MATDVVQKAISANDIVNGAAVIATVSPVVGDTHQDVNPTLTKPTDMDAVSDKYNERF